MESSLSPTKTGTCLAVLMLNCTSVVLATDQQEITTPPPARPQQDAEHISLEGESLQAAASTFTTKCAVCHEEDGNAAGAKMNLADRVWHHGGTLEQIAETIRDGVADTKMKPQKDNLSSEQIADLAKYVRLLAQRMHDKTAQPERQDAAALTSRVTAQLPPAEGGDVKRRGNYIDEHIFGKMKADSIPHAGLSTDTEFLRRIHLDLWGRPPEPTNVREFVADTDPEKRNKLIDRLLGLDFMEKPGHDDYKGPWLVDGRFVSKWAYFFGDLFRNGPQGSAAEFHTYIKLFVKYNIPYDYVVRDMLTTTALTGNVNGAAGFLIRNEVDGLRCADVMHEDTCDEIAVNATKTFLGVDLECISCHDGAGHLEKINLWLTKRKRVEFWRQASFFGNLRIIRPSLANQEFTLLDGPPLRPESIWQGKIANYAFSAEPTPTGGTGYRMEAPSVLRIPRDRNADVYPEFILTKERPNERINPRVEFARMITSHPQFAKATVNLFWSKLMTVGIVDPPFGWDLDRQDPENPPPAPWTVQPSHPELLDALARDFQKHNYDLRHLLRTICRSNAYQLSSRLDKDYKPDVDRYYARKLVRRLSAEEIYDAIVMATGVTGNGVGYIMDTGSPPGDAELKRFLDFFGQSNRITKQAESKGSIIQASLMMNSDLIKRKVLAATEGSRVRGLLNRQPPASNREVVEELFLATLSRFPTEQESATSVRHIEHYRGQGVEDLQWALINKLEFIVNY